MKFLGRLWQGIVNFQKRCIQAEMHMNHVSQRLNLRCPRCKSYLYGYTGKASNLQLYVCRKCKYQGSLGLPDMKKTARKAKKGVKKRFR